ncbi:MAG: hypothetical protein ACSW8J_02900 [bacterium]
MQGKTYRGRPLFSMRLNPGTLKALRRMAYGDGVPASSIVSDLLEAFLEHEGYSLSDEDELEGQVSIYDDDA